MTFHFWNLIPEVKFQMCNLLSLTTRKSNSFAARAGGTGVAKAQEMKYSSTCTHKSSEIFQVTSVDDLPGTTVVAEVILIWSPTSHDNPVSLTRAYIHPFLCSAGGLIPLPPERFNPNTKELLVPLPESASKIAEELLKGYIRLNRRLILEAMQDPR